MDFILPPTLPAGGIPWEKVLPPLIPRLNGTYGQYQWSSQLLIPETDNNSSAEVCLSAFRLTLDICECQSYFDSELHENTFSDTKKPFNMLNGPLILFFEKNKIKKASKTTFPRSRKERTVSIIFCIINIIFYIITYSVSTGVGRCTVMTAVLQLKLM